MPVNAKNPYVQELQDAFQNSVNIKENFGPAMDVKTLPSGKVITVPKVAPQHKTHIHISGQN